MLRAISIDVLQKKRLVGISRAVSSINSLILCRIFTQSKIKPQNMNIFLTGKLQLALRLERSR